MSDTQPTGSTAINPGAIDLPPTHSVEVAAWPDEADKQPR